MRRCYLCGGRANTRDHVLPRAWGRIADGGVRNLRPCCSTCNTMRAVVGHCPAVVAVLLAELRARGEPTGHVNLFVLARAWGCTAQAPLPTGAPPAGQAAQQRADRRRRREARTAAWEATRPTMAAIWPGATA